MTTPPLDLTAHDLAAIRIIAEGTSRGDTMRIKNTAVLRLLDRVEAAERDLAAVTVSRDGWQPRAEAAEKKVAKVREVHPRVVIAVHESHGVEAMCPQCQHHYPCPTITALDNHTPETRTTP